MTKRPQRIQATLTVGKVTIPVRSKLVAQRLFADQEKIEKLTEALVASETECARLRESEERLKLQSALGWEALVALKDTRWVRFGLWVGILRNA